MSLLPAQSSFAEKVTALFLSLRGDGLALSPSDAEHVVAWEAQGVPYEVVRRGLERTVAQRLYDTPDGMSPLRTLASAGRSIKREFRLHQERTAGGPPDSAPEPVTREGSALSRLKRSKDAPLARAALRAAPLEKGPLDRLNAAVALLYLRELPFSERRLLVREARVLAGPWPRESSRRARQEVLRLYMVAVARRRGGFDTLGG